MMQACAWTIGSPTSCPLESWSWHLGATDETSGDNWLAFGRTYSEQRFSPLTQVNDTTVSRLAPDSVAAGMAPDLRASLVVTSAEQFARLLRSGARAARGMPAYVDIADQELTALQHYIRQQAEVALRRTP